jgi:tetratricopeptide (TPR) repeat protein
MTHLTEDELAQYAFDPDAMPHRREIEGHVVACPQCSSSLTFIRSVDAGLADAGAWEIAEQGDAPAGELQAMRNLAAQVAAEDEAAAALLDELLTNPARMVWLDLASRRKYRTAGVVRRLFRAAADAFDREPLDALTFADTAIEVAEALTDYPAPIVYDLRGYAWKDRAYALTLLGRLDAALEALTHAEREFAKVPSALLGPTMVKHARAIVYYDRGELTRAKELLAQSAATYASLGEIERFVRARHWIANVLFQEGDVLGARAIYEELLAWGEADNDLAWIARASNTLGRCAYELRDLSAAVQHFHRSVQAFRELGMSAEILRPEWGFALVVLASGKSADALTRFAAVREQFHQREMFSTEALVALDMMDALHALGNQREIMTLSAEILHTFTRAGMLTSALTAFAYLKEAARSGRVTVRSIEHVRQFVSRLEREPALLFLPLK